MYWLLRFYTDDGSQGSKLTNFIGTLWAIWKLRNAQVFCQKRPTTDSITFQLQDSMRYHAIFVQDLHDPTRNPLDPSTPPGFEIANIGQQTGHLPSITILIAGTRPIIKGLGGLAWITRSANCLPSIKQGSFCYSPSAVFTEVMACLHAITWAASHQYMRIHIYTNSRGLIKLLQLG